jgi:RNA polymerase sigma-70 factor, ECF subfamily
VSVLIGQMAESTTSDGDLLRATRAGNQDAFLVLYRRWQGPIYRFALRMSGSRETAEDVTQEVFMALMNEAQGYDSERGALGSYLYGIARNKVLRRIETERRRVPLPDDADGEAGVSSTADDIVERLVHEERTAALWRAVLGLPVHYREAVVLCDLHALSYEEAASTLGCAIGTVRSRLHRGRELLKSTLAPAARLLPLRPRIQGAGGGGLR